MNRRQEERNQAKHELPKREGGRPQVKKSSFSIIFVTQNGKPKADGRVPILARITVNGEMCHFSTRQTILPDRWVAKDYRTMGRTQEEKKVNEVLDEFKSTIKHKWKIQRALTPYAK